MLGATGGLGCRAASLGDSFCIASCLPCCGALAGIAQLPRFMQLDWITNCAAADRTIYCYLANKWWWRAIREDSYRGEGLGSVA